MQTIDIKTAQTLITEAHETAQKLFQRPVCAAVFDSAGYLIAFSRGDGTPIRSIEIAQNKAFTTVRMGKTTMAFHEQLQKEQSQAREYGDPRLTSLSGGAPLQGAEGSILGAIGISGLKAHEDQTVADHVAQAFAQHA